MSRRCCRNYQCCQPRRNCGYYGGYNNYGCGGYGGYGGYGCGGFGGGFGCGCSPLLLLLLFGCCW